MLSLDPKAARITWTAALTLLFLAAVYAVRGTLVVFAVALLFAYLLYPLVDRLGEKFSQKNRAPALAITYLLVMGILAAAAIAIGSTVADEARNLAEHPPDVQKYLDHLGTAHPSFAPFVQTLQGRIRDELGGLFSAAPKFGLRVLAASSSLIDLVIIPILSFFMIKDGADLRDGFLALFKEGGARAEANRTLNEIHDLLLQYMRSLLFLCCNVLVVFSAVLGLAGVPYALLLAVVAFLCEFVPLVGPLTAAAVIIAVSALSGYTHVIGVIVFLAVFRLLQDYVLSPRLMGKGVELHPLFVIFGVFAGAEIGGVSGVFLSVPVLALGRLALRRARHAVR